MVAQVEKKARNDYLDSENLRSYQGWKQLRGLADEVKQLGMRAWRGEEAPLEAFEHIALGEGEPAFDEERGQAGEQVKVAASTVVAATRSNAEEEGGTLRQGEC